MSDKIEFGAGQACGASPANGDSLFRQASTGPDSPFDPETIQARLATLKCQPELLAWLTQEEARQQAEIVRLLLDPSTGYAAALKEIQALRAQVDQMQIKLAYYENELTSDERVRVAAMLAKG